MHTTELQWQQYKALELLPAETPQPQPKPASWLDKLAHFWQHIVAVFTQDTEIQIWQTHDPSGETAWHLYDPQTNTLIHCSSEHEILAWLDDYFGLS